MGDSFTPSDSELYPRGIPSFELDRVVPLFAAGRNRHDLLSLPLRPHRELPFYSNPIVIFIAVWALMLATLCVRVSYVIYPHLAVPFLIFVVSFASLLLGYFSSTAIFKPDPARDRPAFFTLDLTALWRLNLCFCAIALALIAFNWVIDGPPPALGSPATYLTYGKFKQVLFALLTCIAVNSTLDSSRFRRYLLIFFSLATLAIYIARGVLLVTLLEMFFLFALRSRMSRKKQYLLGLGALALGVAIMTFMGDLRTAHAVFIAFLKIRDKYSDWPMAWLWLVSYISIPFSNLCWTVAHPPSNGPTLAFLYALLPTFMAPSNPYAAVYTSSYIVDNASSYLQTYALDFSWLGIYFANLLLGFGCGWIQRRAYPKNFLILVIFLTSMSMIFFTDMFLLLSTVIQVLVQRFVQKRCFRWAA